MTNQYTNAIDVKRYLKKQILKKLNIKNLSNNLEFEVFDCTDEHEQGYLYIHMKDYSFNGFETACATVKSAIEEHCHNLIEAMSLADNERKQLLWLPKDKNCLSLYEDGYEYKSEKKQKSRNLKFK